MLNENESPNENGSEKENDETIYDLSSPNANKSESDGDDFFGFSNTNEIGDDGDDCSF